MESRKQARERAQLTKLIEKHGGNVSDMTRAVNRRRVKRGKKEISRETLRQRLADLGLLADAEVERTRSGVRGPRPGLPGGTLDPIAERLGVLEAAAKNPNYSEAARAIGISRRQFYRKLHSFSILPAEIIGYREALGQQPAA